MGARQPRRTARRIVVTRRLLEAAKRQQIPRAGDELAVIDRGQQMVGRAGAERAVDRGALLIGSDNDDR